MITKFDIDTNAICLNNVERRMPIDQLAAMFATIYTLNLTSWNAWGARSDQTDSNVDSVTDGRKIKQLVTRRRITCTESSPESPMRLMSAWRWWFAERELKYKLINNKSEMYPIRLLW